MTENVNNHEVYLVGGAVRDELLGLTVTEHDWVVVGSNEKNMLALGFKKVGKDFPVFLHPQSNEEYALARTERKSAPGHQGFEFNTSRSTTLEQDLLRRDLTINAIAKTSQGDYIDPYGGIKDLNNRQLSHVSPAFAEDPLRVLRVARFKAQFAPFNFTITEQTLKLMTQLSENGELLHLSSDRIWKETEKALNTAKPSLYFETLRQCGALKSLFPQVDALFGIPQRADYHPEVDSGIHTMMVLDRSAELSRDLGVRFAALTHDLGKALTPLSLLPRHIGHEKRGLKPLNQLIDNYPVPNKLKTIAKLCCEYHLLMHNFFDLRAETIIKLIDKLDGFRQPNHIDQFALVCQADSQGRLGHHNRPYPQADALRSTFKSLKSISKADIVNTELSGPQIGKAIKQLRVQKIRMLKKQWSS